MLETKIEELTTAIRDLIGTIRSEASLDQAVAEMAETALPEKKPTKAKKPAPMPDPTAPEHTETDVLEKSRTFCTEHSIDACFKVLQEFGVKSARSLKPEQYADYVAKLEAYED